MSIPEGYVRKGTPVYFQLDNDALAMLKEMAPTTKAYGRYLSELVRRDWHWRQKWDQLRAVADAQVVRVGDDTP